MDFKKILFLISLILLSAVFSFAGGGPQRPSIPVPVEQGGTGADSLADLTILIASSGGLLKLNDLSDLNSSANARNNLGLPGDISDSSSLASTALVAALRTEANASEARAVYLDGSRTITATNAYRLQLGLAYHHLLTMDASGNGSFTGKLQMGGASMTGNIVLNNYWLSGDGDNEGVFVKSDGFVGFGLCSNPLTNIHVQNSGDAVLRLQRIGANPSSWDLNAGFYTANNDFWISRAGSLRLLFNAAGDASFTRGLAFNAGADTVASTALVTALRSDVVATQTLTDASFTALIATDTIHTASDAAIIATNTLTIASFTAFAATDTAHDSSIAAGAASDVLTVASFVAFAATDTQLLASLAEEIATMTLVLATQALQISSDTTHEARMTNIEATNTLTIASFNTVLSLSDSYKISTFTATALQTDFTPTWSPVTSSTVEVFVGGLNQRLGVDHDYTVTVGEHVIFNTGLPLDTPVVIQRR